MPIGYDAWPGGSVTLLALSVDTYFQTCVWVGYKVVYGRTFANLEHSISF